MVDEPDPEYGGKMVIAIGAETDGWTPQVNALADTGQLVAGSIYEPLAIFDAEGEVQPWLATGLSSNDDFTEWTATIGDDVVFHDGNPFDAEALKANVDLAVISPLTGLNLGKLIDSVEVIDDTTVLVKLQRPWAAFPESNLTGSPSLMASPAMFELDFAGARTPIGTGPFEFDEWIIDDRFNAVAFDDYWRTDDAGNKLPYLDEIEFRVITDGAARGLALEAGDVDMIMTTRAEDIARFRTNDDFIQVEDNRSEETFIMLNEEVPPFDNENVRNAVAYATNPAAAAVLSEGLTEPVTGPFQEHESWFDADTGYVEFDPHKAREEIELYKEATGEDTLSFDFIGLANVDDVELQQLLAQQWEFVGMDVSVDTLEQTVFITNQAFGNYEATFFRNFAYTSPDTLYLAFRTSRGRFAAAG